MTRKLCRNTPNCIVTSRLWLGVSRYNKLYCDKGAEARPLGCVAIQRD